MGIEPTQPAWKAGALPLSHTRISLLEYNTTYSRICQEHLQNFFIFFVELSMIGDTISERLVKVEIVKFSRSEKFTILP